MKISYAPRKETIVRNILEIFKRVFLHVIREIYVCLSFLERLVRNVNDDISFLFHFNLILKIFYSNLVEESK